jgi:hypothetical protein
VLLAGALVVNGLPRGWALMAQQTWGPPWLAAHLRWAAVLLAGVGLAALLLRDAFDRRREPGETHAAQAATASAKGSTASAPA